MNYDNGNINENYTQLRISRNDIRDYNFKDVTSSFMKDKRKSDTKMVGTKKNPCSKSQI